MNKRYKKHTIIGYYALGLISYLAGLVYSIFQNTPISLDQFINEFRRKITDGPTVALFIASVALSASFYHLYFKIKNSMKNMSREHETKKENEFILTSDGEDEFYKSRVYYKRIRNSKDTDEKITDEDIKKHFKNEVKAKKLPKPEEEHKRLASLKRSQASLIRWLELRQKICNWAIVYTLACAVVFFFLIQMFDLTVALSYAFYIVAFLIASWFYVFQFWTMRIKSFIRLSYCVLYPTILTIAVNLYFGLSSDGFLSQNGDAIVALCFLYFFLIVAALFEMFSHTRDKEKFDDKPEKEGQMRKSEEKLSKLSTRGFVSTSIAVLITAISFFIAHSNTSIADDTNPYSNLLFAVALALFLGIFEGWGALRDMCLSFEGDTFRKHYRWWNFLQICYPLAFFFVASIVSSEILSVGIISSFALVSIISLMLWRDGGMQDNYWRRNWNKRKFWMGSLTILFVILNKSIDINFIIKDISTSNIDAEFILLLVGVISAIPLIWGKRDDYKRFSVAIPLSSHTNYGSFSQFNKIGNIYDFTNYIYILYLVVAHLILFNTKIVPSEGAKESFVTIILLLTIVFYMFLSFKAKSQYLSNTDSAESGHINSTTEDGQG